MSRDDITIAGTSDGNLTDDRAFEPTPRQAAMLIAHLLEAKAAERQKEVTRCRLSEITIRRLLHRPAINADYLLDLQRWLLRAGWILFFAGNTYAVIKSRMVQGWGRVSSKRIGDELRQVRNGRFDFDRLEHLLLRDEADALEDE